MVKKVLTRCRQTRRSACSARRFGQSAFAGVNENDRARHILPGAIKNRWLRGGSAFAIVLDPGGPQAGEPVLVDGRLPIQELVDAQRITRTGFLERQKTAANGGDNLGLAANNPAARGLGRKICNR